MVLIVAVLIRTDCNKISQWSLIIHWNLVRPMQYSNTITLSSIEVSTLAAFAMTILCAPSHKPAHTATYLQFPQRFLFNAPRRLSMLLLHCFILIFMIIEHFWVYGIFRTMYMHAEIENTSEIEEIFSFDICVYNYTWTLVVPIKNLASENSHSMYNK